jgi:thiamine-phosphate pyrophosphorylase
MTFEERMAIFADADLYVVITEAFCAGRSSLEVLAAALDAGVRLVQLREKDLTDRALYQRALQFRELTATQNALLIIDDRVDIALASGADGVHVGQEDLPVEATRSLGPDLIIGCSTHSIDEAVSAQAAGASYVNIGPIFSTQTKANVAAALGPQVIDAVKPHLTIPWTVMGGIKPSNIDQVLERGARRVAVVTAVTAADDVRAACAELRAKIAESRQGFG